MAENGNSLRYALITGGMGFIGTFIAKQLLDQQLVDKVVCIDHFGRYVSTTRTDFHDYRKVRLNMLGDGVIIERGEAKYITIISRIFEEYRPDFIFHLAALPLAKLDNLNSQEAMEGSVESTTNMIELLGQMKRRSGFTPKRFVYASSSMVYGDFQTPEAGEDHPTNPKEIYGTMKLAGEVITRGLCGYYDIPHTVIRPSAVYGPSDMNRRVSQIFVEKAFLGEKLTIHGEDEALDFTYVKDIANGFVLSATREAGEGETFNITHGKAHTLLEYALCLKNVFPDLQYEIVPRDSFRPKRGTLSIAKAKKLIGYEPQYDLQAGITEYVEFLKDQRPEFLSKGQGEGRC